MWRTDDLGSGLLILVAWLGGAAVVVGLAVWWARRRGSDTLALSVTRSIAGMTIGLALLGLVFGSINQFVAQPTWLDAGMREWVQDHLYALRSPACDQFGSFPSGSPADEGALSYCAGSVHYAPFAPRLAMVIASALLFLATVAVAWSVYAAALLASQREPFHPAVHRTFRLAAFVVLATSIAAETVRTVGMTLAARSLSWEPGTNPPFLWSLPWWPFAVALGLFALAAIFRYGHQLQLERARLQKETEGLV